MDHLDRYRQLLEFSLNEHGSKFVAFIAGLLVAKVNFHDESSYDLTSFTLTRYDALTGAVAGTIELREIEDADWDKETRERLLQFFTPEAVTNARPIGEFLYEEFRRIRYLPFFKRDITITPTVTSPSS